MFWHLTGHNDHVGNIATRLRAQGGQGGMWRKLELLASSSYGWKDGISNMFASR